MMSRVQKGLIAGFAATIAVSILEAVNVLAGPWVEPFPLFVASLMGMPGNLAVGWIAHFVVGTVVLGSLFGILCPRMPGQTPETKGIIFAVGAWAVMMVAVLLVGNSGTFAGAGGFGPIVWMLVTHAVFGIVLGNVYARLVDREKRAARLMDGVAPAH
ncbi:MAG: DUF6789 family protein [Pseudomonadota bacterium]